MEDEEEIGVFFRKWTDEIGIEVIALWEDQDTDDMINSYMHVGQHSDAHYDLVNELEPATPEEYLSLKIEMETRGYIVNVREERNLSIFRN